MPRGFTCSCPTTNRLDYFARWPFDSWDYSETVQVRGAVGGLRRAKCGFGKGEGEKGIGQGEGFLCQGQMGPGRGKGKSQSRAPPLYSASSMLYVHPDRPWTMRWSLKRSSLIAVPSRLASTHRQSLCLMLSLSHGSCGSGQSRKSFCSTSSTLPRPQIRPLT